MEFKATNFIKNRVDVISLTNRRIKNILWYVIECYNLLLFDKKQYSIKWVREKTTYKFEDYLKFCLLEDYLIPNKYILSDKFSELEEINFAGETQKDYFDPKDKKHKPDKIDIYINKIGLQKEWKEQDENVYFAIECKRIRMPSDTRGYIEDIHKYAARSHTNLRLPFEGQLAFIENNGLDHRKVVEKINAELKSNTHVDTVSILKAESLHASFDGGYLSAHNKIFPPNTRFKIFHLMLDYRRIVIV